MQNITISVNGVPVQQYVKQIESKEKSQEVSKFLRDELKSLSRSIRCH